MHDPGHDTNQDGKREDAAATGWKDIAHRIGLGAEQAFEQVRDRFDARFRPDRPMQLIAYRGYASDAKATVSARVLRYSSPPDDDPTSVWDNLQASYRRFETDEVAGARVFLDCGEDRHEALSDEEGYVHFEFVPPAADGRTLEATLTLEARAGTDEALPAGVTLTRPGADARFGVISDVDDTVLVTDATSLLKMMRLTLLESSASRVAFPGVAELYRALEAGRNPLFYVSSSPWNLHDFLEDFMRLKRLPAGPLLLRDLGIDDTKFVAGAHGDHKLGAIRGVLERYPGLDFVLIGDSGQHDPEIYATIVREFPGRILAIYIRDVSGAAREREVTALVAELREAGVELLLVPDSLAVARHAATAGLVPESAVAAVARMVEEDLLPRPELDEQAG